jgi:class 3 adenylate cyclase/tetratricopeptide (TPR) repeat protein/energy-coupling factor transporter ATP-binding protein EcfA2
MRTCPSCGRENADDVRFCGDCGTALAATEAREVRKTVTVLFADVTESTALGEKLDPEALRRVMGRYFDEMKGVLESHGGTVEKFIGDAVMAVFGVPTLHEDDALRAVLSASEMRERLAALNGDLERDFGVAIEARIGVNTGEVVTGQGESGQRLATGDAVNVAARLEQAAAPGEILLGESTLELARHAVDVEAVEPLALKGKSDLVVAYRLRRVTQGASGFERRLDAPLVGRKDELARVRASFDAAVHERRCELVTVVGPPGIGKSRLAREVAGVLRDEATVLSGRCLPYGEGITYWPLYEIFRAAGAEDELDESLAQQSAEDVFWAVRKAVEKRAREQPLALVVEDIHWAEPTLLDLLEHLTEWTRDAPVLLLCLSRPELLEERQAWRRDGVISLAPLSQGESDILIEELLDGARLEESTVDRIRDVAEGNPLFVEQLLAMISEGGEHERVPPTIQALLAARLDGLPEEEREVLEQASVIGLEFEWEALGGLTSGGRRPAGPQLAALVRKDLIQPHELIGDTFRFRHILIRDAAYERVPKRVRSELHERVAAWLEPRGDEFDEIVAYHLEQAYISIADLGPVGEHGQELARRAADQLIAAALRADARGDAGGSVNLLERGLAILPAGEARRLQLLPFLGRALREAGEMDRAEAVLWEAVELAEAADEPLLAADASLTLSELRFHQARISRSDFEDEVASATRVFRELGDDLALARALAFSGRLHFWIGRVQEALEDYEQAALLAREAGNRGEEAEYLHHVVSALTHGPTSADVALPRIEELRCAEGLDPRFEVSALLSSGWLNGMQNRFEVARDLVARGRELAQEFGMELTLLTEASLCAGSIELLAGDGVAAEAVLRPSCERLEEIGEVGYLASVSPLLADALCVQGLDEEALRLTDRWRADQLTVAEDVDAQAAWRRVRAKAFARVGELDEGERLAREAMKIAERTDHLPLRAWVMADLAEVLRLAGRPDEAAAATREALRLFEAKGNLAAVRLLSDSSVTR